MMRLLMAATLAAALGACGASAPHRDAPSQAPGRPNDRLTVCIDGVGSAEGSEAVIQQRVIDALVEVAKHEGWEFDSASGQPPDVQSGCPEAPVLRQVEQGEAVGREPRVVAEPGYFSLFIFVLSPADISGLGPGALWAFNPEEVICDEGGCTEITQGLYLAVDALPPQDYLIDLLEKSIGLESRDDEYEPGYHPAEGSPRDLSRLAICVDAVGEARETRSDSVKAVRDAMSKVQEHEIWAKANFGSEPIVDEGCPAGPSLYDPESGPFPGESLFFVRGRVVDRPSYYWEFVFVVPAEDIPTENETRGWRFTREEVTCSGDNCVEATGGLYLTPNDVADEAFLVDQLEKAVGLEDPTDPLRPGYYPEEPD